MQKEIKHSDAQVFKDRWEVVKESDCRKESANIDLYYYGLKFGFSEYPTFGVRSCIDDENNLIITHEAVQKKIDLDNTREFLRKNLKDLDRHIIYADNARPVSILFLKKQNMLIEAVKKCEGSNSIEDGIEYIKSFNKIYIHERCRHMLENFMLYSFKVDERSGQITRNIIDANNDGIDALRYALEPRMKNKMVPYSKWIM